MLKKLCMTCLGSGIFPLSLTSFFKVCFKFFFKIFLLNSLNISMYDLSFSYLII